MWTVPVPSTAIFQTRHQTRGSLTAGLFPIDIAEVQTAEGKLHLYVAIDRTSKFAFVQVVRKTGRTSAPAFLVALINAVPYRIHTVLMDNGIQFTFPPRCADGPTARYITHMFDMRCRENGIEHRLTKVKHPWTNGQSKHPLYSSPSSKWRMRNRFILAVVKMATLGRPRNLSNSAGRALTLEGKLCFVKTHERQQL
jgi:hypothetical protein